MSQLEQRYINTVDFVNVITEEARYDAVALILWLKHSHVLVMSKRIC